MLVVVDSLRADLVRPDTTPFLARLAGAGCRYAAHRSVFPSTTRTASASIATGCLPRHHGLLGNAMALDEGAGLIAVSTAPPDFRERLRAVTGRVLLRPTLAERLAGTGADGAGVDGIGADRAGAVIFSNASPGAAHMQDPDGHGFLYNRAGSHGPGLRALPPGEHLDTPKGSEGDARATDRFVEEAVLDRQPPLAVLWLSEPDHTGHGHPLGGPEHLEALAQADACVARVAEAVEREDPSGDEVLLIVTSDHGQETTDRIIHVEKLLTEAGLKATPDSTEIVPASQGTAVLFFAAEEARGRVPALVDFLESQPWAEEIYADGRMGEVGHDGGMNLVAAVSMRKDSRANEYGVPGHGDIMFEERGFNNAGCGQHGGTGPYEQSPFLILRGGGFEPATVRKAPTSPIDIAPTVLRHLNHPTKSMEGMDGRPLQDD